MATAKNMKELAKLVEQMAAKAMQKSNSNVKKVAVETGQSRVDKDVYSYDPKMYERTGKLRESWETEDVVNGISLENTRRDGSKEIDLVIETGEGYDYTGYGYEYEQERPFVSNTAQDLSDGRLVDALGKDLNSMGIKTK